MKEITSAELSEANRVIEALQELVEKLEKSLSRHKKDTERLDKIEIYTPGRNTEGSGWSFQARGYESSAGLVRCSNGKDLREAIDSGEIRFGI